MAGSIARSLPTQRSPFHQPLPPATSAQGVALLPHAKNSADGTLAGDILKDAVFYIDALDHQKAGSHPKIIRNLGVSGADLDARCGSTSVADSNDPKFLDWQGVNYVYLPGTSPNYLSTPDAAVLDITGDIDLRARIALDDWTPSLFTAVLSKMDTSTPSRSYELGVNTDGTLRFHWSADGSTGILKSSTVATGVTDGATKWIRVTLDVDNGSTQNEVKFYTSDDGSSWTQLGTTVTTAGVTSIFSGTSQVDFGAYGLGSSLIAGKLFRAQIYNGIAGTLVFDADTSVITSGSATTFTELSSNAATVTINRATSGRKSVAVVSPCWLFGTDDYLEVRDNPALNFSGGDSMTVMIVERMWATFVSSGISLSKSQTIGAVSPGYRFRNGGGTPAQTPFEYSDSNTFVNPGGGTNKTSGVINVRFGVIDKATRLASTVIAGTTVTATNTVQGSASNTLALHIGVLVGTNFNDLEMLGVAIFRRALSASEISTLNTYFQGRWS